MYKNTDVTDALKGLPRGSMMRVSEISGLSYRTLLNISHGKTSPYLDTASKIYCAIEQLKNQGTGTKQ